ncbi:hypothetical protein BN381_450034 [Candidatus Microthrix parvicella RN1]|uniref:Uncharacterized protein n=1 Tax=Candidatus Neomicrothrix parvicella RN1 TaxID=1229780 RepID=R4Z1X3_9ACTN|nr:hypothetical protein BN381_450034 [Candidatus Microthrix parvicella RN1]
MGPSRGSSPARPSAPTGATTCALGPTIWSGPKGCTGMPPTDGFLLPSELGSACGGPDADSGQDADLGASPLGS